MTEKIEELVVRLHQQKGEIVGINTMLTAMARCLPPVLLARLLNEFEQELKHAKSELSYQAIPDEVISGLDDYGRMWEGFRSDTPRS
ncbi:hypothetical protein ABQX22_13590 [Xanthomonas sp. WHRI 1810A]|uniref:hypothetical protein n=1 Tax=Xanthomonas sp. WHRI 1810A TaxID=3161565 RepID=UPI0032E933CE